MNGKRVLITDGGHPSAAALAEAFLGAGAIAAVNNENNGSLNFDLTSSCGCEGLINKFAEVYGGLDVVIHNNNRPKAGSIQKSSDEQLLSVLDFNMKTAFFITQAAGKYMKSRGGGSIIYLSSIHGEKPTGSSPAYSMAKAGVKMLAKETAIDFGPYNVRANVIEMGPVPGDGQLFHSDITRLYDNMKMKIPGGRTGSWDEAARLALFLAGDSCPYINGESITVDGGFLLHYFYKLNYEEWENIKNGSVR